ncbi:MAG TPA: class I SAM-dependent methyltransferase [Micromonosporaceae bacterium]|nr:class I SAM-dependent methyltransferase [Micromonosporaceae bacterium]
MRQDRHHGSWHLSRGDGEAVIRGRRSRLYNFAATHLFRGIYRRLARDIAGFAPDGGHVLDVGTGPGVLLAELARIRPDLRLTGVDPSADMVDAARRNCAQYGERIVALEGDAARLPLDDRSADVVVSSFSLHHWDDPAAAAPELARVLRPGGRVVIYDFRTAPFDALIDGAWARSVLGAEPAQREELRIGFPLFTRSVRLTMMHAGAPS